MSGNVAFSFAAFAFRGRFLGTSHAIADDGFGNLRFGVIEFVTIGHGGGPQFVLVLAISLIAILDGPQSDLGHRDGHGRKLHGIVILLASILFEDLVEFLAHQRMHDAELH